MGIVVFEEWRDNFMVDEVFIPDVLYVRATRNDVSYTMPVFDDDDRRVADAKLQLIRRLDESPSI